MSTIAPLITTGGHCCVCSRWCLHVGGPWFCAPHDPQVVNPATACPARTAAVLGFPEPAMIPCGLLVGHEGPHRYQIEWSS